VLSGADRRAFVFRDGEPLGHARLAFEPADYQLPRGVFSYVGEKDGERQWLGAGLDAGLAVHVLTELRSHVVVDPEFLKNVQGVLSPGDTMVVTPHSVLPPSLQEAPIE
jgi:hypothetical protein